MVIGLKKTAGKFQIANRQLFMVYFAVTVAYGHFVYTHLVFMSAGREAWLSLLIGGAIGVGIFYLRFKSDVTHPDISLDEFAVKALGKWLGSIVTLIYILFFTAIAAMTLSELSTFLGLIYPRTPEAVFLIFEFSALAWAVRSGIEVITRTIEILLPGLIFLGLLAALLSMKDKDPTKLLPLFDHSALSIWQGSIIFITMTCELVVFGMFVDNTEEPSKLPRQSLWMGLILILAFLGPVTGPIMIFGEKLAGDLAYPTYTEIQYIRIADIIERLDIIGILLWTIGSFFRAAVFMCGASKAVAHLFHSKKENTYALPLALFTAGITISFAASSREELHTFLMSAWPVVALFCGIVIPMILALVNWAKQRFTGSQSMRKTRK